MDYTFINTLRERAAEVGRTYPEEAADWRAAADQIEQLQGQVEMQGNALMAEQVKYQAEILRVTNLLDAAIELIRKMGGRA